MLRIVLPNVQVPQNNRDETGDTTGGYGSNADGDKTI